MNGTLTVITDSKISNVYNINYFLLPSGIHHVSPYTRFNFNRITIMTARINSKSFLSWYHYCTIPNDYVIKKKKKKHIPTLYFLFKLNEQAVLICHWAFYEAPTYNGMEFPNWATVIGYLMMMSALLCFPAFWIYDFAWKPSPLSFDSLKPSVLMQVRVVYTDYCMVIGWSTSSGSRRCAIRASAPPLNFGRLLVCFFLYFFLSRP